MKEEITITLPEVRNPAPAVMQAQRYVVMRALENPVERRTCSEIMGAVKADRKAVWDSQSGVVKRAFDLHRELTAKRNEAVALHDEILAACEKLCRDWDREQKRLADLAAAEQERANQAEERRLAAIAARCKNPEKKAAYQDAAQQVANAPIAVARPDDRAAGEVRSKRWRAECVDLDALIDAANSEDSATRMLARRMLAFDLAAATREATSFRRDGVVPGVRFVEVETISHRGA
jgi:hypothetical protein